RGPSAPYLYGCPYSSAAARTTPSPVSAGVLALSPVSSDVAGARGDATAPASGESAIVISLSGTTRMLRPSTPIPPARTDRPRIGGRAGAGAPVVGIPPAGARPAR